MEPGNHLEEFTIIAIPQAWDLEPDKQPECCIYRVPRNLRNLNEDAYTPKEISIGPFHHGKENLKKKEELKLRCVQEKELKIHHCYAKNFHEIIKEDFVKMILLDSIFIIEHLWWTKQYPEEDNIHESISDILHDLILLENQVPFSVLEELYNFAYLDLPNHHNEDKSLPQLIGIVRFGEPKKVKHLTDFQRCFLLPQNRKCGRSFERVPCATKLSEAGVEFKVSKSENGGLLDIQFRKSALLEICPFLNMSWLLSCFPCFKCLEIMQPVLELKSFVIRDATESVVRNLMALEQCHYPWEAYVCNYIVLLDHLINTEADVDLLVEKNIIVNWLGNNKAVAILINHLCQQIVEGNHSCYFDLSEKIKDHYSSRWSKLMASFTNLYFKDFWRGTATVVGIMVLFFAFWNFLRPFVFHT
ncbi:hypothetical protein ACB092_11G152600 [Castanea dentata]